MQVSYAANGNKARITLNGDFTFEAHRDFKQSTMQALEQPGLEEIEIDFASVDYMDSAALGMLLLLKERAAGCKVVLCNCRGTVWAVLDIANFGKIFEVR